MSTTIVFASDAEPFRDDRAFDVAHVARYPGAGWLPGLRTAATARGWRCTTLDQFERERPPGRALLVTEAAAGTARSEAAKGVERVVLINPESPNVARRFYHGLGRLCAGYRHAVLFSGLAPRVPSGTSFHPLRWPNALRAPRPSPIAFADRRLIAMVASNKRSTNGSGVLRRAASLAAKAWIEATDPLMRFEDLYARRLAAIEHFAGHPGFALYGARWDQRHGLPQRTYAAALRAGARAIDDKLAALAGFRFNVCFENCVFPGYVTEKIFDAFFAGCVPVYLGAPDIGEVAPPDTFVDARRFASFEALQRHLEDMDEPTWRAHLDAAAAFLASPAFAPFHQDDLLARVLAMLDGCAR